MGTARGSFSSRRRPGRRVCPEREESGIEALQASIRLFVGVLLTCALALAHDPNEHTRSAGQGSALDPETREYYFELFAELVERGALSPLDSYVAAVGSAAQNELILGRAEALYSELRATLPVIAVQWDGQQASLVSSEAMVVARGVERFVLVEVENLASAGQDLTAHFEDRDPGNVPYVRRGATRGVVTRAFTDNPEAQQLELTVLSGAQRHTLSVPIQTVEPARLVGRVEDSETGALLAGRVSVLCPDGEYRHGEAYRDIATLSERRVPSAEPRTYRLPHFYSDGTFELSVPPGQVVLTMDRGFEFSRKQVIGQLAPGETRTVTLASRRFVDMRRRGWISGETHVHWVRDSFFRNEDIDLLGVVQRAEDIQVVNNLTLRHRNQALGIEWIRPNQAPMGPVPGHDAGPYRIQMGQEFRNNPFYGHHNFLNLTAPPSPLVQVGETRSGLIMPVSTGDLLGPFAEDYPVNYMQIDAALRQRPAEARPIIVAAHGIAGEAPADVALGRIDSLDQVRPTDYYRFLDAGFRVPLTDGADFPAGEVGKTRCYVKIDREFTYGAWIDGILAGSTFVTSGPLLWMTTDERPIGSVLYRQPGASVNVKVHARSRHPLGRVQVVSNHEVLYDQRHSEAAAVIQVAVPADRSRWIVARCSVADEPAYYPFQEPGSAHTSATYLLVGGERIYVDSGATEHLRNLCRTRGDDVFENGLFAAPGATRKRLEARDYFYAAADVYQALVDAHQ